MFDNSVIFYLSSLVVHITFCVVFGLLGDLSRILGEALKKRPLYKLMYVAACMVLIALVLTLWYRSWVMATYLFDILALAVACFVTVYYWKWLPGDLLKG